MRRRTVPGRVSLTEIVREAVASVSGMPGRSLLTLASTLIGIASLVALIGIASLVALMGIAQTAAGQINVGFSLLQTTLVSVRMDPEQMTDADPMGFPDDATAAVTALNGVQSAALYWQLDADALDLDVRTRTSTQNLADSLAVYAADAGVDDLASSVRADGTGFTDYLVASGSRTAILGERAAEKLGVDDLRVPTTLSINGEHFTVIGVLGASESVPQLNTAIIIPSQTALTLFGQPTTQHPAHMTIRTDVGAADLIARQVRYALRPDAPSLFIVTAPQDWSRATGGVEDSVSGLLLAVAVVILVIGQRSVPIVSLTLALTFGLYSLVKKDVAARVDPLAGMAIETAAVSPILLGYYAYLAATSSTSFHTIASSDGSEVSWVIHLALLLGAGALTMIPLIMFASAARGLTLGTMGFLQYLGPTLQLLVAVFIFHETVPTFRWIAMGVVWVALSCLSADWLLSSVRAKRLARAGHQD